MDMFCLYYIYNASKLKVIKKQTNRNNFNTRNKHEWMTNLHVTRLQKPSQHWYSHFLSILVFIVGSTHVSWLLSHSNEIRKKIVSVCMYHFVTRISLHNKYNFIHTWWLALLLKEYQWNGNCSGDFIHLNWLLYFQLNNHKMFSAFSFYLIMEYLPNPIRWYTNVILVVFFLNCCSLYFFIFSVTLQ